MAINNPRIIIVEDQRGLADIVRASLDLLGRKPRMVQTHTGEDALDEIRLRTPDLLVTAHALGGEMSGSLLALQAKREVAALPVIVVAGEDDPEMDETALAESPYRYLRRPLVPELFIRELRTALDGPEAVSSDEAPTDVLGPVPQIDLDKLRPICAKLMRDVTAMSFVLADRNGKVLSYDGMAGYVDRELLSAATGPTIGATSKLMPILGDQPRLLKYYDGDKFDIYCLSIGVHYFVSLIFDGVNGNRALGNVARFGRAAVDEMLAVVGEPAFHINRSGPDSTVRAEPEPRTRTKGRRTQEAQAVRAATPPKRQSAQMQAVIIKPPALEPIANFDPSILDALDSLDLSMVDSLFDPEKLGAAASAMGNGNRISQADAEAQGIINWQEE